MKDIVDVRDALTRISREFYDESPDVWSPEEQEKRLSNICFLSSYVEDDECPRRRQKKALETLDTVIDEMTAVVGDLLYADPKSPMMREWAADLVLARATVLALKFPELAPN